MLAGLVAGATLASLLGLPEPLAAGETAPAGAGAAGESEPSANFADAPADAQAVAKVEELEKRYGVRISRDGQAVRYGTAYGAIYGQSSNWSMRTRTPNSSELASLEEALAVSNPSHLLGKKEGSPGISIYFLKDSGQHQAFADWGLTDDGKPAVFVEPAVAHYVSRWRSDQLLSSVDKLKAIFVHELSHNSAYRMGYDNLQPDRWKLLKDLGWLPAWNPRTRALEFLIVSKESKDVCFKFSYRTRSFVRCDRGGHFLTDAGSKSDHLRDAVKVPIENLSFLALVPPITYYCFDPMEVFAEAMMAYRLGGVPRAKLKELSPALHDLVRLQDQAEIDMTYGKGRYGRGEDGRLKDNQAGGRAI